MRSSNALREIGWLVISICLFAMPIIPCRADLWGLSQQGSCTTEECANDPNLNKVFRFDTYGNKLANDIAHTSGISNPTGIAVGQDGNIYVSWAGAGSILYYNGQTGAPLGTFASLGEAAPAQLAFGPDGNLYVSEFF